MQKGFTLIELLIVIGIIAVLATVVLVAINPSRQFKQAHDTQRISNVNAILNAIGQRIADNKGLFKSDTCTIDLPITAAVIKSGGGLGDIGACLAPIYISSLPFDPTISGAHWTSTSDYDTEYSVLVDSNGRVTVSAVGELTNPISVTR